MANPKHVFDFESILNINVNQDNWKDFQKKLEGALGNVKMAIDQGMAKEEAEKVVGLFNKVLAKAKLPDIGIEDLNKNFEQVSYSIEKAIGLINNIDTSVLKGIETSVDRIADTVDRIADKIGTMKPKDGALDGFNKDIETAEDNLNDLLKKKAELEKSSKYNHKGDTVSSVESTSVEVDIVIDKQEVEKKLNNILTGFKQALSDAFKGNAKNSNEEELLANITNEYIEKILDGFDFGDTKRQFIEKWLKKMELGDAGVKAVQNKLLDKIVSAKNVPSIASPPAVIDSNTADEAERAARAAVEKAEAEKKAAEYAEKRIEAEEAAAKARERVGGSTGGGTTSDNKAYIGIDKESLKSALSEVVYNVKIQNDDTDKGANKITLDEGVLKTTLQDVFGHILNPTEQDDTNDNSAQILSVLKEISQKSGDLIAQEETLQGISDKLNDSTKEVKSNANDAHTNDDKTTVQENETLDQLKDRLEKIKEFNQLKDEIRFNADDALDNKPEEQIKRLTRMKELYSEITDDTGELARSPITTLDAVIGKEKDLADIINNWEKDIALGHGDDEALRDDMEDDAYTKVSSAMDSFRSFIEEIEGKIPWEEDIEEQIAKITPSQTQELTEQEKLVEQYNQNKQKTLDLLKKEQLSYEEILYLVKEIQTEYARLFYADKNYDLGDEALGLMTSAYNKLRRGDMIDPRLDKAINGVGMSAEEGARILTDYQNRQNGIIEDVSKKIQDIDDDDVEIIEQENGALEDKLERLQQLSDAWGQKITQKNRDRWEELNQKDMDSGLTTKEEERMSELYEQITAADEALEEFGQTYDKIILKLGNGKKLEILPDDKGLRDLYTIGDEYGSSYKGVDIEDVVFERVKKEIVENEKLSITYDELKEKLEAYYVLKHKFNNIIDTVPRDDKDMLALADELRAKEEDIISNFKLYHDERGFEEKYTQFDMREMLQGDEEVNNVLQHMCKLLGVEIPEASKKTIDSVGEVINPHKKPDIDKSVDGNAKVAIDTEALQGVLEQITYNVNVVKDSDAQEPWATDSTLIDVKSVLDNIQTSVSQIQSHSETQKLDINLNASDVSTAMKEALYAKEIQKGFRPIELGDVFDEGESYTEWDEDDNFTRYTEYRNKFTGEIVTSLIEAKKLFEEDFKGQWKDLSKPGINEALSIDEVIDRVIRRINNDSINVGHSAEANLNTKEIAAAIKQALYAKEIRRDFKSLDFNDVFEKDIFSTNDRFENILTGGFVDSLEQAQAEFESNFKGKWYDTNTGNVLSTEEMLDKVVKFADLAERSAPNIKDFAQVIVDAINTNSGNIIEAIKLILPQNTTGGDVDDGKIVQAFERLTSFIAEWSRSTGNRPSAFFKRVANGANVTSDAGVKDALRVLGLVSSDGTPTLKVPDAGKLNLGTAIGDTKVVSTQSERNMPDAPEVMAKISKAVELGAAVPKMLAVHEEEVMRGVRAIFNLQERAIGKNITDYDTDSLKTDTGFLNASTEQIDRLIHTFEVLEKVGLQVDLIGDNILFDDKAGFSMIDFEAGSSSAQDIFDRFIDKLQYSNSGGHKSEVKSFIQLMESRWALPSSKRLVNDSTVAEERRQQEALRQQQRQQEQQEEEIAANAKITPTMDEGAIAKLVQENVDKTPAVVKVTPIADGATDSQKAIQGESQEAIDAAKAFVDAAKAKKEFVKANQLVAESAEESAAAVKQEAQAVEHVSAVAGGDTKKQVDFFIGDNTDPSKREITTKREENNAIVTQVDTKVFDQEAQAWLNANTKIIQDFEKFAKQQKKAEADIKRAQKKLNEFLSRFQSKTGGKAKLVTGFNDFFDKEGKVIQVTPDNINDVFNQMTQLQAEYAELEQSFRKGQSSLNPFVNAINKSENIENIFGAVEVKFNNLLDKSEALTNNFTKLRQESEYIQEFTQRMNVNPDSITTDEFAEFARRLGKFNVLKTQVEGQIKNEGKGQTNRNKFLKDLELLYVEAEQARAKYEVSGSQRELEHANNIKLRIEQMREAIELTEDEIKLLEQKSKAAYEAQQRESQGSKTDADRKKDLKQEIKNSRDQYRVNRANSVYNSARNIKDSLGMLPDDINVSGFESVQKLNAAMEKMSELRKVINQQGHIVTDTEGDMLKEYTKDIQKYSAQVKELVANYELFSNENSTSLNAKFTGGDVRTQLEAAVRAYERGAVSIKSYSEATKQLTYEVQSGAHEFTTYTVGIRDADDAIRRLPGTIRKTETFIESFRRKFAEITRYFSASSLMFKGVNEVRKGIQYIKEIDAALVELRKVTDETEETYDKFLQTASKTADKLGSTISAVTEATATFAKLGYTMEMASQMSEAAIVYKNVGDNIASTEDAADSIISTLKGFGLEASEAMRIVDRFNEVGNRFAITSQGIGEALKLSASALNEGSNTLDESIGLITAANEVVNDPSSVGTALKTLTLRLRGSKTQLEEMGEDVSDMATTTSQLQAKLLALTGGKVDIMLDQNTFKSSTQILREMAAAWEDMNDISRASALELMGGKRQANVLSALITNFDTAEEAIKASANSAGSAIRENEVYLDSIQGKIDLLTNATQTMWSNLLDSDTVKDIVSLATALVKVLDAVNPLNVAFVGLFAFLEKKYSLLDNLFNPAKDGVEELEKQLEAAKKRLAKAEDEDIKYGTIKTAESRRNAQERVNILQKKMEKSTADAVTDPELNALIGDRDTFAKEVDLMKAKRDELRKAIESNSSDNMLKLIEVDTTSIDDEIAEVKEKLQAAQQNMLNAQAEPTHKKVKGGIRINKERDKHIADASTEIASIEKDLDALQKKKMDTIHYAAQFDLAEMDAAIGVASGKLDGMTEAINAKTAAQNASNIATNAGIAAETAETAATQVSTNADVLATIASDGKVASTWADVFATLASKDATLADVGAKLKQLLITKLLSSEYIKQKIAAGELTVAQMANMSMTTLLGLGFKGLAAGIKQATIKMLEFMTTTPIGWILLAAAAIATVVTVILAVTKSTKELREELSGIKSEISNVKSEIESLNSELETTQERIAELLAKDSLTFTEQEELENLQKQNDALEREIYLLEQREKRLQSQAQKTFDDLMGKNKNLGKTRDSDRDGEEEVYDNSLERKIGQYEKWTQKYEEAKQALVSAEQELEAAEQSGNKLAITRAENKVERAEEKVEKAEKKVDKKQSKVNEELNQYLEDADGIDYESADEQTKKYLDYIYNTEGRLNIINGDDQAKSIEIKRIFNKGAMSDAKDEIDGLVEKLSKNRGDQTIINQISDQCKLAEKDLEAVGLSVQDAIDYFTKLGSNASYNTIEGKVAEIDEATKRLNEALGNVDTSSVDTIKQALTDNGWVDTEGNLISDVIAEYFGGEDGGISDETREEIERLVKQIYDGKITVQDALKSFELFGVQSVIEIQIAEVKTNFQDVFVDLEYADGLVDTFKELGEAVGSTADALEAFNQAQADVADKGFVSIQTALQLMEYTDDYGSILEVVDGKLQLAANAEQNLIQARIDAIKVSAQTAVADAQTAYDKAELAVQSYRSAMVEEASASTVATAWQKIVAVAAGIKNALDNIWSGESIGDLFSSGYNTYLEAATGYETKYDDTGLQALEDALTDAGKKLNEAKDNAEIANALTADSLEDVYKSSDKSTTEDVAADKFQKEMDYWENRISANQAKYDQIQNEIDLLEAKGMRAGEEYYREQIELENERKSLLEQQKAEALARLATLEAAGETGSDQWWEAAEIINSIEGELDDVIASVQELNDAIGQIRWDGFEELHERFSNLTSDLENIRDILSDEDMFDDEGNFTKEGVANLATYIQELEIYKNALADVQAELADFQQGYEGNEDYFATIGIDSEQEYYDKLIELTDKQDDYTKSIKESEQSVVEMYENQIDAVEEYIDELIDGYNDYIDSCKDALDAERDLYNFKKNVQKQTKDIASIERRIAALSGSTNASDVAERRKLEAQLLEAKEGLNDTYYDHAKDQQAQALDDEAKAYEESMNKYLEGLREMLEEATKDMTTFLSSVTNVVMQNAGSVADTYNDTGLALDSAIVSPWAEAAEAMAGYEDGALSRMNDWTKAGENGYFYNFNANATSQLKSPWSAGTNAANTFATNVNKAMSNVYDSVQSNVDKSLTKLNSLTAGIQDTNVKADGTANQKNTTPAQTSTPASASVKDSKGGAINTDIERLQAILNKFFGANLDIDGSYGPKTTAAVKTMQKKIGDVQDGLYASATKQKLQDYLNKQNVSSWFKETGVYIPGALKTRSSVRGGGGSTNIYATMNAKGTLGTSHDQWAITDESWIGEEITLAAGKNGKLQYLKKGSAVMPADISANLVEWGKLNPDAMKVGGGANLNMISNAVVKPELNFEFDSLVHVDNCSQETLKDLEKMVDTKINQFSKQLNYAIKKYK